MKSGLSKFALIAFASLALTTGCDKQQTAAELVSTAGTAVSSLLVFEGNTTTAAKINADFAAASTAISGWKSGSPTQDIAELLNIVEDDLNLIPISTEDQAFIDLGIGAVDQLLALFPAPAATTPVTVSPSVTRASYQVSTVRHVPHRRVYLAKTPKTAKEFKAQWNALRAKLKPGLAPLK